MSLVVNLFLFPVRLLMKMLWLLMPLFILMCFFLLVVKSPYIMLSFSIGFLIAPRVLRKLDLYHTDATNSLSVLLMKYREIQQLQTAYKMELNLKSQKNDKKVQRLQKKIQKLKEETNQLERKYNEIVDKKPDRILYIQPRSFLQLVKNRLFYLGR